MSMSVNNSSAIMIGSALLYSGMQFALGSVEQSSRFSVSNFSKDQKTLQAAADALSTYIIIAILWTLASCLVLYGQYGKTGIFWGLITNIVFAGWIVVSYLMTFKKVAKDNGLKMPKMFNFGYDPSPIPREIRMN
jgi:hypothetical protein